MVGVLHPQDVCVVLKCIVGVFSCPLGVVMFPLCVCSLSPSISQSLIVWQLKIAHRWCSLESVQQTELLQKRRVNTAWMSGRNRREETVLTRLRFDHTGLNKTLFLLGKSKSDECTECKITENTEHVLLYCRKYRGERIRLKQKISQTGRKWNLEGVLGTTGEGVKDAQDAVVKYLKNTGVYYRI